MKVSEHLAAMHKAAHGHHTEMIAAHETALKKAADMEDGDHHVKFHKAAIASHQQMVDFHEGALEECQKAAAASGGATHVETIANRGGHLAGSALATGDLDGPRTSKAMDMVPDNVRGIVPNFPGITAIPRAGQRPLDKVAVDPELEFLVSGMED